MFCIIESQQIIKAHDNWDSDESSTFLGDPEGDEKAMTMDTPRASYDSRDNRSRVSISGGSRVSGRGRSGRYSGNRFDRTQTLHNLIVRGASGISFDRTESLNNSRTTQSIIQAIAEQGNQYEVEKENQRLRAKVAELETWIEEIGKPSEILVAKLEDRYIVGGVSVLTFPLSSGSSSVQKRCCDRTD